MVTLVRLCLVGLVAALCYVNYSLGKEEPTQVSAVSSPPTVERAAVLSALSTKAQIVGLTGRVEKAVAIDESDWYGARRYDITWRGEFKLGVNTADIGVRTEGNRIYISVPAPQLIALSLPFDEAIIKKDVGFLRSDLTEAQLQALYSEAEADVTSAILADKESQGKAVGGVEQSIRALLAPAIAEGDAEVVFE